MSTNHQKNSNFEFIPSNYNVLILDDAKSVNHVLTKSFHSKGYNCFSTFTIKEAKEVLANNEIHYVMLDINLPDGNGYEIITLLERTSVKIFVLTTESDKQFREISYQKGIIDFIVKDQYFFHKVDQITKTIENIEKNKTNTILLIDDSVLIQEQLRDLLENRHYNVVVLKDLDSATKLIDEMTIDLILLDLELKNENALDFLKENNNEIVNIQKIPVLVVSGNVDSSTIRDSIKEGAVDVLTKPYVLEEIVLKIDFWTDYKRKEDEIAIHTKNLKNKNLLLEEQKVIIEEQNNKLENQIELEKQINQQKEEFLVQQSKMASMGEMLENIIHQWRQPLTAISACTTGIQLKKELACLTDDLLDESLTNITSIIQHLSNTLTDFSDYLKPNRKKVIFKLDENIDKSIFLLSSQFRIASINIIKNTSDIPIMGLKNDFVQAVLNILNNAKDALKQTNDQKKFIFIDMKSIDVSHVEIKIKDNAGGIPLDVIDKIFEAHFTTKEEQEGTGIGLYMTKEIIEKYMFGKLDVRNVNYEYEGISYTGAEFIIILPMPVQDYSI